MASGVAIIVPRFAEVLRQPLGGQEERRERMTLRPSPPAPLPKGEGRLSFHRTILPQLVEHAGEVGGQRGFDLDQSAGDRMQESETTRV